MLTEGVRGQDPKFEASIFAKRFAASGVAEGGVQKVTPTRRAVFESVEREFAKAALLDGGAVALVWTVERSGRAIATDRDVEFRIVSGDGRPLTPIVTVNAGDTVGDQSAHDILHLGQGYTLIVYASEAPGVGESYEDFYGVNGRIFGSDGSPLSGAFFISQFVYEDIGAAEALRLSNGDLGFVWDGGDLVEEDVYGRLLGDDGVAGVRQGAAGPDVVRGDAAPNLILAGAGNDRADGLGGADAVFGEAGNDILVAALGEAKFVL